MEFRLGLGLSNVFAFLMLMRVGSHATSAALPPQQVYWNSILPHTPMPKALNQLLVQPTCTSQEHCPFLQLVYCSLWYDNRTQRKDSSSCISFPFTMSYPYAVFGCHTIRNSTRAYVVLMAPKRKQSIAVCHADTSEWPSDNFAFKMLNVKPGTIPICHFLPEGHLVWVPDADP